MGVGRVGIAGDCPGLIWIDSVWLRTLQEPLSLGPDCFLRAQNGQICLFSKLGSDWKPRTTGIDRAALSWVRHYSVWMLPGLEYQNRLLASGESIWSLEFAIVIPFAVVLTTMAVFWRVRTGHWLMGRLLSRSDSRRGQSP